MFFMQGAKAAAPPCLSLLPWRRPAVSTAAEEEGGRRLPAPFTSVRSPSWVLRGDLIGADRRKKKEVERSGIQQRFLVEVGRPFQMVQQQQQGEV